MAVPGAVRVLDAAGFSPIVIETVGVGQVEVDVVAAADTAVVVATPGMGDAVQANKAGLLEVADLFVVNKADRPGAADVRRDLELMLDLAHVTGADTDNSGVYFRPQILMVTATAGIGVSEVVDGIADHLEHLTTSGGLAGRRAHRVKAEVRSRAHAALEKRLRHSMESVDAQAALQQTISSDFSPVDAARKIVQQITGN